MKPIKFYAPEWGNTLPFAQFCQNVNDAGYDGVEMALPPDPDEYQPILDTLRDHDLELIGQYWQSFETDLDEHARSYETYLRHLANARPVLVNCQTGKDYFTLDLNRHLFDIAARISAETGDYSSTPKIETFNPILRTFESLYHHRGLLFRYTNPSVASN